MDNYMRGYMAKEAGFLAGALGLAYLAHLYSSSFGSGYENQRAHIEGEKWRAAEDARNKARTDVSRLGVGGSALGGMLGYALADEEDRLKWGVKGALLGGGAGALAGMARGMNYFNEGTA